MLTKLTIKNVALISYIELDFCGQLNILSGETGAGKSIIVDSLMLLIGQRYDKTLLKYGETEGFVEGLFLSNNATKSELESMGFDAFDDCFIVNRKFTADGRNEIRINGKMSTTSMLRQLMNRQIDIYGQNEFQTLAKPNEHLRILDYYVRNSTADVCVQIAEQFEIYKKTLALIEELGDLNERENAIDLFKYQIDEIEAAAVKEGEEDALVSQRKILLNSEKINENLKDAYTSLYENERESATDLVDSAAKALQYIGDFNDNFVSYAARLEAVSIELNDISDSISDELDRYIYDETKLEKIENRLAKVRDLKRKYGDYDKMTAKFAEMKKNVYRLENAAEEYELLQKKRKSLIEVIFRLSSELSMYRRKGAAELAKKVIFELNELGMKDSVFEIVFNETPTLEQCESFITASGFDMAEFYLSPNSGQPIKPLMKIISGGEMSRFMLALKVISSANNDIPTLIFDEIDAGISGIIGQAVAQKLARLSRIHQVLCVTHLPQIAAMADHHYLINKISGKGQTQTCVDLLTYEGMIDEISRLSGGKNISAQSFENAKEMKKWSDEYKNSIEKSKG